VEISIDTKQTNEFVPFYERCGGDSHPLPVFLELDHRAGCVSFGKRRNHLIPAAEAKGLVSRWPVPAALRGAYSTAILKKLKPLLQIVQDGYSEELADRDDDDGDSEFVGVLNDAALAASEEIGSVLAFIDRADPFQVAAVWDPQRMLPDLVEITNVDPKMTDEELEELSNEYLVAAEEQGIYVDGSLFDELVRVRENMREDEDEVTL